MNFKLWLQGLAAAAIGGAATGGTQALGTGVINLKATGLASAAGALVTVLAYLAKSPLGQAPSANCPTCGTTVTLPPPPPAAQK